MRTPTFPPKIGRWKSNLDENSIPIIMRKFEPEGPSKNLSEEVFHLKKKKTPNKEEAFCFSNKTESHGNMQTTSVIGWQSLHQKPPVTLLFRYNLALHSPTKTPSTTPTSASNPAPWSHSLKPRTVLAKDKWNHNIGLTNSIFFDCLEVSWPKAHEFHRKVTRLSSKMMEKEKKYGE